MCDAFFGQYKVFGSRLRRQIIVGIPIGTNCDPFDADLILFAM